MCSCCRYRYRSRSCSRSCSCSRSRSRSGAGTRERVKAGVRSHFCVCKRERSRVHTSAINGSHCTYKCVIVCEYVVLLIRKSWVISYTCKSRRRSLKDDCYVYIHCGRDQGVICMCCTCMHECLSACMHACL